MLKWLSNIKPVFKALTYPLFYLQCVLAGSQTQPCYTRKLCPVSGRVLAKQFFLNLKKKNYRKCKLSFVSAYSYQSTSYSHHTPFTQYS